MAGIIWFFALTLNIACPTLVLIASLLYRAKEANSDKFFALSVPMLLTASSVLLCRSLSDLVLGQFRPEWGLIIHGLVHPHIFCILIYRPAGGGSCASKSVQFK